MMVSPPPFEKVVANFYQKYKKEHNLETVELAIYHNLASWHDNGSKSGLLKNKLITSFKDKYPNIELSNPPLTITLGLSVQEWVCGESEDYSFGNSNFSKESVDDIVEARNKFVKANKKDISLKRFTESTSVLEQTIASLLPKVTPYTPKTCFKKEVHRQLKEVISQFWDYSSQKNITGVKTLHESFVSTVCALVFNSEHDFNQRTEGKGLLAYLYLFQDIYFDEKYSKDECISWSIFIRELPKFVNGAGSINDITFWCRNTMGNHLIAQEMDNTEALIAKLTDKLCCANLSYKDKKVQLVIWSYPNKDDTLLTITVKPKEFIFDGAITGQFALENINDAQTTLIEHFTCSD
ncbi:MAG: hypothetical protein ACJAS9_003181 [Polaribacter sp.]|jgi:hypothetical protein